MHTTILLLTICLATAFGGVTPAERAVAAAKQAIEKDPKAEHYSALAMALARRARETADPEYYRKAQAAVDKSLELSRDNFDALKARCWVLLGQHEFAQALDLARKLNKRTPDDVAVYGFLTDAHIELGNYKEAEEAAQWMLDIGRGNIPGLTRAAYLRELFGDIEGSLDLMNKAVTRMDPNETEDRAWGLTHIGHLLTLSRNLESAQQALDEALRLVPDYHYALAAMAKVRAAQGRHDEAVQLLRKRYEGAPHPENLFDVGAALHEAGKTREGLQALREFEKLALAESAGWDNANRELIAYYCDYANDPKAGLRIAEREIARRHDVLTRGAYAWALFRDGRKADARKQIDQVMGIGTIDPKLRAHAVVIRSANGVEQANLTTQE